MREVIGKILQEELKKEGAPTAQDFAKMIGISSKTLYNIYNGSSELTLDQLIKASSILNTNLLQRVLLAEGATDLLLNEPQAEYKRKKNSFSISINLTGPQESATNLPELINNIKDIAITQGFVLV
jgi:plasmid maintenance system antidote protein VapI